MAAQMDCDDARSQLKELERQRLALEDEAAAIVSELDGLGVGLKDALVDAEGYPRADLDLYRVRSQRGRHATIRTDHKALMKKIEVLLPIALAAPPEDARKTPPPSRSVKPPPAPPSNAPWCSITEVRGGSPAAEAGLRLGDLVVAFGDAISLDQVKPFVLGHVGRPFAVWVQRGNNRVKLDMTARTWAGEGCSGVGLTLAPVNTTTPAFFLLVLTFHPRLYLFSAAPPRYASRACFPPARGSPRSRPHPL